MEEIISKIERLLREKGWSQKDLADASGVSQANISRYLKGKQVPGLDTLVKLAEALGIGLEQFTGSKPSHHARHEPLDARTKTMLKLWQTLEPDDQDSVLNIIRSLSGTVATKRGAYKRPA